MSDVNKIDENTIYKVDNRVTIKTPYSYSSSDIVDGPTLPIISGVRVNEDIYIYSSGT